MVVQSSSKIGVYRPTRFMFTGNPTAGKTHLAATFPKPFFMDFDDGCRRVGSKLPFDFEVFDVMNDSQAATHALLRLKEFIALKTAGKLPYRTLVLDSLTTWSQAQMDAILTANGRKDGKAQIQDYGALADDMRSLFGMAIRVAEFVILIAHEDIEKDELTGAIVASPICLGKKFIKHLPGYVDDMWFCESRAIAGKRSFSIKTLPDSRHPFLRTAIANMPQLMEDPSFEKIAKLGGFWEEPKAVAQVAK